MKILVTGANGYIGQGVVKKLVENGQQVIAADVNTRNVDERAKKMDCDIFSIEDPYEYFDRPDILLHLAWRDGFIHNSNNHILDLPKHYNFIKAFVDSGIQQVAVMGSMHEIGFFEGAINENTPCNPQSLYGISKNALRNALQVMCKEKNTVWQWLRGYYIVGNSKYGNSIFSKITTAEIAGKKSFPFTTGQNQFDFLDYEDFCNDIMIAVLQNKITGIIEICSGYPEKLSDRVEKFISDNGYSIKLQYGVYPDRIYDSKAVWGNNAKISEIISAVNIDKTKVIE